MILSEKDNGRQVQLAPGDRLTIRLPDSSASAGYCWIVDSAAGLRVLREATLPAAAPGASGTREIELEPLAAACTSCASCFSVPGKRAVARSRSSS